ncbi:Uncharacterised protein [Mycobacteroides abscessus subsp. abscessus]|nr:Uncharacterised protein [Mycobacteroides abscessus subsp. abscessus]
MNGSARIRSGSSAATCSAMLPEGLIWVAESSEPGRCHGEVDFDATATLSM